MGFRLLRIRYGHPHRLHMLSAALWTQSSYTLYAPTNCLLTQHNNIGRDVEGERKHTPPIILLGANPNNWPTGDRFSLTLTWDAGISRIISHWQAKNVLFVQKCSGEEGCPLPRPFFTAPDYSLCDFVPSNISTSFTPLHNSIRS